MPRHLWQRPALRRRHVKQRSSHTRERNQRTANAQNGALRSRPEEFRNRIRTKADIRRLLQIYEFTPQGVAAAGKAERTMDGMKERAICPSCQSVATDVVDLDPKSKPECALSRAHQRGVSRSSRTLARDAVDASGAFDESADCGRRSRVVLTPRRWRSSWRKVFR